MVLESWESIQGNQNVPLSWALASSMHKSHCRGAHECLWVIRLEWAEVEELLSLLVFVWSCRSEKYGLDRTGTKNNSKNYKQCATGCTSGPDIDTILIFQDSFQVFRPVARLFERGVHMCMFNYTIMYSHTVPYWFSYRFNIEFTTVLSSQDLTLSLNTIIFTVYSYRH